MDRKYKRNSQAQFSITVEDFEAIMNKESLCNLPSLVNLMDENLGININDLIKNPILSEYELNQAQLIETIKSSNKFHYDNKTGLIKFKEKADRNILIIGNYVNQNERKEKEEFVTKLIREYNFSYASKIKKIDTVGNSFHVVFENEDISMDVEKYLDDLLKNGGRSEKSENLSEKENNYFCELKTANICLAAESLKRRVLTNLVNNPLWKQTQFINKIIGSYMHRRNTAANNSHINLRRESETNSKIENSKNFKLQSKFSGNVQSSNLQNYLSKSNSKIINNKDSTIGEVKDFNIPQKMFQNFSNKHQQRNSKVLHNKFDIVSEINQITNAHPVNFNTTQPTNSRKVSYRDNLGVKSTADFINIPLNKEYEVDLNKKIDPDVTPEIPIKLSYSNKEIVSVYFHMNFLKKFELPQDFKDIFIIGVMNENSKSTLENFKAKKSSAIAPRERARTLFNYTTDHKRHSSMSKLSLINRPRFISIHHDIVNMLNNNQTQRKRELSMKAK